MNVAIIGCGYLGLAVAEVLTKQGFHVTATTRNSERLSELSRVAQKSVILKGNDEDEFIPLVANNDIILVMTAADKLEHYESAYLNTAQILKKLALEMDLPRDLIYTSSTSVYGDHHGRWVDETSDLLGKKEQIQTLIEAEKIYASLEEIGWNVCILRLSEIYGPGREISKRVRTLGEHTLPGTGAQYTNMIHKSDCVGAIQYILRHNLAGVFNLSDDEHPTRQELYDRIAQKFDLSKVQWDPSLTSLRRGSQRVSNHKIKKAGFRLSYPDRDLI